MIKTSHNKLYAGRRRFMTQYVKLFPLPELNDGVGQQIVSKVKRMLQQSVHQNDEAEIDELVWQAFGFAGSAVIQ